MNLKINATDYLDPPIPFHNVEHSIFRVELFVFGSEVSKDVVVGCSKRISVRLAFALPRYLFKDKS